jgi:hypothetical protein
VLALNTIQLHVHGTPEYRNLIPKKSAHAGLHNHNADACAPYAFFMVI